MNLICPLFKRAALIGVKFRLPVAGNFDAAVLECERAAGHQLLDTLEEGILTGDIGQREIDLQHLLVEFLHEALLRENVAEHRAVKQSAVRREIVVEGLGAEVVAEADGLAAVLDRKRKHAVEMIGQLHAPCFIALQQNGFLACLAGKRLADAELAAECFPVADMTAVGFQFHKIHLSRYWFSVRI